MLFRSMMINDKLFDPKIFLQHMHKNTSYKDLEQGAARLKSAIDKREDSLKGLIKDNFSKFVNAKGTIHCIVLIKH